MTDDHLTQLEVERDRIDQQIMELRQKRDYVQQLIRQHLATKFLEEKGFKATKKNQREIYYWAVIRQMLIHTQKEEGKGLQSREIYKRLTSQHETIKYSTLRSYLHRFSKMNRITKDHASKTWIVTESIKEK